MSQARSINEIRVAVVSTGLSHVQRGYETFILDLYEALKDTPGIHLFKGSGVAQPPQVNRMLCLPRSHGLARTIFPGNEVRRYRYEQLTAVASGWLTGKWYDYDIIHSCDPTFCNAMLRLRKWLKPSCKLIFANCGPSEPRHYQHLDHIQEFTPYYLEKAHEIIRRTRLHMIPMGIRPEPFQQSRDKAALRERYGLPQDKLVIVCVASLDEPYKRQSFLIEAVADLNDPDLFVWLVGSNQGSDNVRALEKLGAERLPGRFASRTVPYAEIPEVYAASDIFALPSLTEGFGKVYLEAMAAGLPVLCHDNPNTQWIVRDPRCRLDMENPADLQRALSALRNGAALSDTAREITAGNREWVAAQFHWDKLGGDYLSMYEQVVALPG